MMRDNLESNSKTNSLAEAIIVKWRWNDSREKRIFQGLRLGGNAEVNYDLEVKYPEESIEQESVLLYGDQLINLTNDQKKTKISDLLSSEEWSWEGTGSRDFMKEINGLI